MVRLSVGHLFRSDLASVILSIRLSVGRAFQLDSASVVPGLFTFLVFDPRPSTFHDPPPELTSIGSKAPGLPHTHTPIVSASSFRLPIWTTILTILDPLILDLSRPLGPNLLAPCPLLIVLAYDQ
jgi:hypothetical protein